MRFRSAALTVVVFAAAMAYLESAVVVYLQRALEISPDHLFPLSRPDLVGDLTAIEVGREFATLVMLVGVGCLAGSRWVDRVAWTSVAFGVWDIGYYFWLWVFIGWPHSPVTWDVLFLIPVPWAGPVWAPITVSGCLVGFGLAAARQVGAGGMPRVNLVRGSAAVAGGSLVVGAFIANAPALVAGDLPGDFPWPIFVAGLLVAGWAAVASLRAGDGATAGAEPGANAGPVAAAHRPLDGAA